MPDKKQYLIEIPGMEGADVWDANRWEKNKDDLLKDHEDANVFEVDAYNPEEEGENDQYMISLPQMEGNDVWDADRWAKNKEDLLADHPDAIVQRIRYVDYWGQQAEANRARKTELQQPDEERNARLADLGYYDDMSDQKKDFSLENNTVGLKPVSSAIEQNSVSGEITYHDPKLADFYANDSVHNERMAEIARLDEEYESNPSVIARKQYEEEKKQNANRILQEAEEAYKNIDHVAVSRYHRAFEGSPTSAKTLAKGIEDAAKDDQIAMAFTMLKEAETLREGVHEGGLKGFGKNLILPSTLDGEDYKRGQQALLKTFMKLQDTMGPIDQWSEEKMAEVLTKEEKLMVDSFFELASAQSDTEGKFSEGYDAGRAFAHSVPFMIDFAISSGMSDMAAKPLAEGLTKVAAKKLAKKAGESLAKRAVKTGLRQASRLGIGVLQSAVSAAVQTPVQSGTSSAVMDAMLQFDEETGRLKTDAKTAATAYFDRGIENFSEGMGEVLGGASKTILGGTGRALNKAFKTTAFTRLGGAFGKTTIGKLGKAAGIQNGLFEMAEEAIDSAIRDITIDKGAWEEFADSRNLLVTALSFLPTTVLGGSLSLGQIGAAKLSMERSESKMQKELSGYVTPEQMSYIVNTARSTSAEGLVETMKPILVGMQLNGASKGQINAVRDYMVNTARYQTLMGAEETKADEQRKATREKLEQEYGKFYYAPIAQGKSGQQMELSPVVRTARLKNGRDVYIVSNSNEMGEFLTIDMESKKKGTAKESDIAEQLDNSGKAQKLAMTESLDDFLSRRVMLETKETEAARMKREYQEQVDAIRSGIQEGTEINLGTEGSPVILLATGRTSDAGVDAIDQNGVTHTIGWDQTADALGKPIIVLTDAQIVEKEIADIVARDAERKAQRAQEKGSDEIGAAEAVAEADETISAVDAQTKHIPMNEDGTVNEAAFWEQDPEGYAQWNDEQNQDGGADTIQQIEAAKAELTAMFNEAQRATLTSNPANRKAAKREVSRLAERLARLETLEQSYADRALAPLRERAKMWADLTGAQVHVLETEEELAAISSTAASENAKQGSRVRGFAKDGRAYIFLPGIKDIKEIDEVFFHEAVAHNGLKGLLGKERFDKLCESVWNMMSQAARNKFISYPGVNGNYLAAADEYIAHIAEKMRAGIAEKEEKTIWQQIVDWVRNALREMGFEIEFTEQELSDLLHQAYADLGNNMAKAEQIAKGEAMSAVEETPSEARQQYDTLLADLTPEEAVEVAENDYQIASDALKELMANQPKVEKGESSASYIERKKAYNESLREAQAKADAARAIADEIKKMYIRHTTDKQSVETAEASQVAELSDTRTTSSMIAPTTSSEGKDSNKIESATSSEEEYEPGDQPAINSNANQQAEGNTLFSVEDDSLVGMHNISEEKLKKVIKQGGMANPSTAVIDISSQSFTSYGDISLVMPSSLVDAKSGRNAGTFTADAWTPVYPQVSKRFSNDKGQRRYWKDIAAIPEEMQGEARQGFDGWTEDRNSSGLAYMFLLERNEAPEMVRVQARFSDVLKNDLLAILGEDRDSLYKLSDEEKQAVLNLYIQQEFNGNREAFDESIATAITRIEDRLSTGKVPSFVEKRITMHLQWMKEHGYNYENLSKFVDDIIRDIRHAGEVNAAATTNLAIDYIRDNNLVQEFELWKESLDERYGIKEYLWGGYTPSGNQRWLPNTIENASKLMNQQGLAGAVGITASFNRFVATLAPKVKSLSDIKSSKDRLVEDEKLVDEFRDKWSEVFYDLGIKCQPGARGYEDYGLARLIEAAQKKNPGAYLKKEYNVELSKEDLQNLSEMISAIKNDFPARYFETKFQRPVYLNEFAAAVMPTTTSEDVKKAVSEAGLPIYEYDSDVKGARAEATRKAADIDGVRFSYEDAMPSSAQTAFESAKAELASKGISINDESLLNEYGLSDLVLSQKGNYVTLSKIVVRERNKGNGTRFMQDFISNADKNGWILTLTPDDTFGASSVPRLKKFYKRFGFKDNKGRSADFNTRESMIRLPKRNTMFSVEDAKNTVEGMFAEAISGKFTGKPKTIGVLTEEGKAYLESISGIEFKDRVTFVLNPSDLNHIYKEHFGENEKDTGSNIPLNIDDIRNIVDVMSNPERVLYLGDDNGKRFAFLAPAADGAYNLVEVYTTKRGNLSSKTFYKTKKGVSHRAMILEKESEHSTSETNGAALSATNVPKLFDIAISEEDYNRFVAIPEQDAENSDIRFSLQEEGQSSEDFHNAVLDDFKKQFNVIAPTTVVRVEDKEAVARALGLEQDELFNRLYEAIVEGVSRGGSSLYLENTKRIAIFAKDDQNTSADVDDSIFHENTHALVTDNPELLELGQWLWDNASKGARLRVKESILDEGYPEWQQSNEMLARYAGSMLAIGRAGEVLAMLPADQKKHWEFILNAFGYEPERDDRRRIRRYDSDSARARVSAAQSQQTVSDNGAAARYSAEERRIINELFPGAIQEETRFSAEEAASEDYTRFSVVTDPALIEELENGPKIKVYRAMQLIDGELYPPMSAKIEGKLREPIQLGQWEQAEERPDLIDSKGNFKLDKANKASVPARYNPYFHTSRTPLNDQFSSAQSRPNLVTVEVEIPESELTSGYKADKAKDSVGEKEWKAGVIQGKLSGTRKVILSRWDKPVRIVPDSEVAAEIVKMFEGKDIAMPSNVVTPSLRAELEKLGVPFVETDNNGKPVAKKNSLLDVVKTLFTKGKQIAAQMFSQSFFDVVETPEFMKAYGLTGDKFTVRYGVIARHFGKDGSHDLSEKDWNLLPSALQNPFAITKIKGEDKAFRIYTSLQTSEGEYVVVGVDVKNAGRDLEVNAISTLFGRRSNANLTQNEEVIYQSKDITPEQSSLLKRPNSSQYPTEQELSDNKDSDNSENSNKSETKEKFSVIATPAKDVIETGMPLSVQDFARLAGNIFEYLPENMRLEVIENTFKNGFDMQSAIFNLPEKLALKETWNEDDRELAKIIREKVQDAMDESGVVTDRPLTTKEALWMLYQSTSTSDNSLVDAARRSVVANNLGFDVRSERIRKMADEHTRLSVVLNDSIDAATDMYNYEANLWTNRLKESWSDMNLSVIALQNALAEASGKPIEPWENLELALNQLSSKSYADKKRYLRDYLRPLWDAVIAITKASDYRIEDIERYMMLKHALERNVVLARRDAKSHYQRIYDEILNLIKSLDPAQKKTYLTNAHLQRSDAKAKLATLKAVDTTSFTEDQKRDHKQELAKAYKAVEEAEQHLFGAEKVANLTEAEVQNELDAIYKSIENGSNTYYLDLRDNDYGGLTSMFVDFDRSAVGKRSSYKSEEAYQKAVLAATKQRYDKVADMEAAAKAEVDAVENDIAGMATELWNKVNAATKEVLRHQHANGMITTEQYDAVRKMFQYYVPLRGFADNTAEDMYSYYMSNSSNGFAAPLIGAKGRKTRAESPLGWIGTMAESAIQADNKNDAKMRLYYALLNRPDTGVLSIAETWYEYTGQNDANGKKIFAAVYPPATGKAMTADELRQHVDAWEASMMQKQAAGNAFKGSQSVNLKGSVVFQDTKEQAEHIIRVKVAGKDYSILVNGNPRAAQAINGLLNPDASNSPVGEWVGNLRRYLSALMTSFSPLFWVSNYQRDLLSSFMRMSESEGWKQAFKYLGNRRKAWRVASYIYKNEKGKLGDSYYEKLYKEFAENGGITGYTSLTTNKEYEKLLEDYAKTVDKKAVQKIKNAWRNFIAFGEAIEQVSRFAAFITAKEAGKSTEEAVNAAKEVSVNFNRKGSAKPISLEELEKLRTKNGKPLNKAQKTAAIVLSAMPAGMKWAYFFFNASVQALSSSAKLAKQSPGKAVVWAGLYMGLSMGLAAINYLISGDDDEEEYLDLPDYTRRSNALVKISDEYYLKWSLPQEMRPFYAIADIILSKAVGNMPHKSVGKEVALAMAEWLPVNPFGTDDPLLSLVPDFAAPLAEIKANKNFVGGKIYDDMAFRSEGEKENIPAYRKATSKTGELYVDAAEILNAISGGDEVQKGWININPAMVEHLIEGYGGGLYDFAKMMVSFPAMLLSGEEIEVRDIPFVNKVALSVDETNMFSHTNEVFYYYKDIADNAERVEKEYRNSDDPSRADAYRQEEDWRIHLLFEQYDAELKDLNEKLKNAADKDEEDLIKQQQNAVRELLLNDIAKGNVADPVLEITQDVRRIKAEANKKLRPGKDARTAANKAKKDYSISGDEFARRMDLADSLQNTEEYKRNEEIRQNALQLEKDIKLLQTKPRGEERDSLTRKLQEDYGKFTEMLQTK